MSEARLKGRRQKAAGRKQQAENSEPFIEWATCCPLPSAFYLLAARCLRALCASVVVIAVAALVLLAASGDAWTQSGRRRQPPPPPAKPKEKAPAKEPPEEKPTPPPTIKKGAEIAEQQDFPEKATTRFKLKNGLTLIVRERYSLPLVAIGVMVKAGRLDETDDLLGVAQLTERMLFRGTSTRPENKSVVELQALGGLFASETYEDRTFLGVTVPAENALRAIEILADALQHPILDADELKREIETTLQEESFKLNHPEAFSLQRALAAAFIEHGLRRERIAPQDVFRAITREKLDDFYRSHYRGDNITVVIVGAVNTAEVTKLAQPLFGDFEYVEPSSGLGTRDSGLGIRADSQPPSSPQLRTPTPTPESRTPNQLEPPQTNLRYSQDRGDISQPIVTLIHHAAGFDSPDRVGLQVLATVLGRGQASRLYQGLREGRGIVSDVRADSMSFKGAGVLVVQLRLDPENLDRAESGYFEEIDKLRREVLSPGELQRAKSLIEKRYLERLGTFAGESEVLAYDEAFFGDFRLADKSVEQLNAVTAEQVQQVAAKYLLLTNATIHEYLPTASSPRQLDAPSLAARITTQVPGVKEIEIAKHRLKKAPEVVLVEQGKRQRPGEEGEAVVFSLQPEPLKDFSVFEGPRAFVRVDRSRPLVTVGIFFQGGRLLESVANSGITELMLRSILKGTAGRTNLSAPEVAQRFDQLGGEITIVNEADFFGFLLDVLSRNQDQAMRLLVDLMEHPAFTDAEVARERAALLSDIRYEKDDPVNRSRDLMARALYGELPYGLPRLGREESVKTLTGEHVRSWHAAAVSKHFPLVMIVGDTDGSALISGIVAREVRRRELQKVFQMVTPKPPTEQVQFAEPKEGRAVVQTLGFFGPPGQSDDNFALTVLKHLGFGPGSKLMTELRNRQALAHTVEASVERRLAGGLIAVWLATAPESETSARQVLESHIGTFTKEPVSEDDLRSGINASLGSQAARLERRSELTLEYARAFFFSSKPKEVENYEQKIRGVTTADIQRVAANYLKLSQSALGVVRGKAK